ncbi:MAG: interleukin [Neisseriaceae bacterium]|nr:interleukin [Neisseriaceae bacterium]
MGKDIETNLLSFEHKNKFSKEYHDREYEQEFVDFFKNNYELLKEYGAEEFVLMMDIFYCDQCNFEIFDKGKLKELAKGDVSLPISVYYLEPDDYYSDLYYQLNPDLKYGERL